VAISDKAHCVVIFAIAQLLISCCFFSFAAYFYAFFDSM